MSTRSNIAIQKPDGTILSIYVHSDGYPDGVGQCLIDNYKTYISAEKLFRYGDASYLGSNAQRVRFLSHETGNASLIKRTCIKLWSFKSLFRWYLYRVRLSLQRWTVVSKWKLKNPELKWFLLKSTKTIQEKNLKWLKSRWSAKLATS